VVSSDQGSVQNDGGVIICPGQRIDPPAQVSVDAALVRAEAGEGRKPCRIPESADKPELADRIVSSGQLGISVDVPVTNFAHAKMNQEGRREGVIDA